MPGVLVVAVSVYPADAWHYEEWDVEVKGRLYRICCELPSRNWYVTGVYD